MSSEVLLNLKQQSKKIPCEMEIKRYSEDTKISLTRNIQFYASAVLCWFVLVLGSMSPITQHLSLNPFKQTSVHYILPPQVKYINWFAAEIVTCEAGSRFNNQSNQCKSRARQINSSSTLIHLPVGAGAVGFCFLYFLTVTIIFQPFKAIISGHQILLWHKRSWM